MLITIVTATAFEVLRLRQMLAPDAPLDVSQIKVGPNEIHFLHTGIGLTNTALHLGYYLSERKQQGNMPDLVINMGIAGSYDRSIPLCTVGNVVSDLFADLGAEMADGSFQDLFQLGFQEVDTAPYGLKGEIKNIPALDFEGLPQWYGLSVQTVSGTDRTIAQIQARYPHAQIESMEGAAFFLTCQLHNVPHLAIRSISNYVEPRNRAAWKVAESLETLSGVVRSML
jgi:futalosine hydrolase